MVKSLPGEDGYLRNIEYGGSPLTYFYGHFLLDEKKNMDPMRSESTIFALTTRSLLKTPAK